MEPPTLVNRNMQVSMTNLSAQNGKVLSNCLILWIIEAFSIVWCAMPQYGISLSCFAILCNVMLCQGTLCYFVLCYALLCYDMPRCHAMLYYAILCYAMLCHAISCYAILCYVMLCHTMLYYALIVPCLVYVNYYLNVRFPTISAIFTTFLCFK